MISLKDAVENAISWEEKARDDYLRWADETDMINVKKLLNNLAAFEQTHVDLLKSIKTQGNVYVDMSPLRYIDVTRNIYKGPSSEDRFLKTVLEHAIDKEDHSIERYKILTEQVEDPKVKRIFNIFVMEEKHHKQELLTEYNKLFAVI